MRWSTRSRSGMSAINASRISSFFFQAEDGIRDLTVTGVQTCALPIFMPKTIKNEDGTEEEVFTAEELEAKAAEERTKAEEEKETLRVEKEGELAKAQEDRKSVV